MHKRRAFTLIEVLVAVMIVFIVIAAMLELAGESSLLFKNLYKKSKALEHLSMLRQSRYAKESGNVNLALLLTRFMLDDTTRRVLKQDSVKITYKEVHHLELPNIFAHTDTPDAEQIRFLFSSNGVETEGVHVSLMRVSLP